MAEELGLPWKSLSHFLLRCDSVEEAVKRCREQQENRIVLWGREYQNRQEVAEMFGLQYSAIAYGMNCKKNESGRGHPGSGQKEADPI